MPTRPKRSRILSAADCSNIECTSLEPYVLPPIYRGLAHPSVAPYIAKAQHLERTALRPAYEKTAPYAIAIKRTAWDRTAVPLFNAYVAPQYQKHIVPQWRKHAGPYIARVAPYATRAQLVLERTAFVLHKTYSTRVAPAAARAYAFGKPHTIRVYRAAKPACARAVRTRKGVGGQGRGQGRRGAARSPVGTATQQGVRVPEPASTAASSDDSTTELVTSETKVAAVVTPVEEKATPSATPEPAEEVPAVKATSSASSSSSSLASSSGVLVEASTVTPPRLPQTTAETASVAEELSAASIAVESAHGMESPVVEEILADVKASVSATTSSSSSSVVESSSSAVPTPTPSAPADAVTAASVVMQSAHGMETAVVEEILTDPVAAEEFLQEPLVEEEPEEDFSSFLDDIGLAPEEPGIDDSPYAGEYEPDADEDIALTPAEIHALEVQAREEQAFAKQRDTKEKRADLESRMAESKVTLTAMVKEKNKQLRKTLVGLRKAAVAQMDDPRTVVGGAVPAARKEGEKMLAGLEGYLKKEEKAAFADRAQGKDLAERANRWTTVVARVEEKLGERVQTSQGVITQFHVELKAKEVDDGLAIINQLKEACTQEQGKVGLDLSWLDDVTYMDWRVYHALAEIGENFQVEASAIQAGTHAHPPVDPFLPRLNRMQSELTGLVNEFIAQIQALRQRAEKAFSAELVEPKPTVEDPIEAPTVEDPVEEPTVSILPVEPPAAPPAEPGVVDPAQVILGKTAEQVEQALKNADAHDEL
ncbi:hypothetical protein C8R46DRAFT_1255748 [Mycena filopes]|nr:hypothetical protein C8R46DRAFT_1255748 [Mycena filopes]